MDKLNRINKSGSGILWLIPHFCHADALSFLQPKIRVNALYRPLRNPVFDDFVKKSRQRFEVSTIDRKDGGMIKTLKVLKKGEILAMLFDQNAGGSRYPTSFYGNRMFLQLCQTYYTININQKCFLFILEEQAFGKVLLQSRKWVN